MPVDTWTIWRDGNAEDVDDQGELVTVTHITKTGKDTYKTGTYDDALTTYTNVHCVITERQITGITEPEGRVQVKYYIGLFRYDQVIGEADIVSRADGTRLYVIDVVPARTGGTLSYWIARMSAEMVPHGQE